MTVSNPSSLQVSTLFSIGGSINLTTSVLTATAGGATAVSQGSLTIGKGTLAANGGSFGAPGDVGGSINILTENLVAPGVSFQANGVGSSSGGQVLIQSLGAGSNLSLGGASGFSVSATGGTAASSNGAIPASFNGGGGVVEVVAGGNLTVNTANLSAGPLGAQGSGAYIFLRAGFLAQPGNLSISGSINANGAGQGDGGELYLISQSASPFTSGSSSAPLNGVSGSLQLYRLIPDLWVAMVAQL